MNIIEAKSAVSGKYKLKITKPDGSIKETEWFSNLILLQGLDYLGATNSYLSINACQVGTGTSTPVNTQVALDAFLAGVGLSNSAGNVNQGSPTYANVSTFEYDFPQGAVIGNITEIGIGTAATMGNNLFSRALITDGSGPVAITLTSIDQLTVYYALTITPPLTPVSGTVTLGSTSYPYTTAIIGATTFCNYPVNAGGWGVPNYASCIAYKNDFVIAPITDTNPSGTQTAPSNTTSATRGTYVNGTYYLDNIYTWGPPEGNDPGGIGGLQLRNYNNICTQVYFPTPIPKTSTQTLTLVFRFSWSA